MPEQRPLAMNVANMSRATEMARSRVKHVLELAEQISTDARKAERLARHECKGCFYSSRLGGAAITQRACMSCAQMQTYGSTATDVLCMPCAQNGELCKHCGGDIEMRARRRNWPKAYASDQAGQDSCDAAGS